MLERIRADVGEGVRGWAAENIDRVTQENLVGVEREAEGIKALRRIQSAAPVADVRGGGRRLHSVGLETEAVAQRNAREVRHYDGQRSGIRAGARHVVRIPCLHAEVVRDAQHIHLVSAVGHRARCGARARELQFARHDDVRAQCELVEVREPLLRANDQRSAVGIGLQPVAQCAQAMVICEAGEEHRAAIGREQRTEDGRVFIRAGGVVNVRRQLKQAVHGAVVLIRRRDLNLRPLHAELLPDQSRGDVGEESFRRLGIEQIRGRQWRGHQQPEGEPQKPLTGEES